MAIGGLLGNWFGGGQGAPLPAPNPAMAQAPGAARAATQGANVLGGLGSALTQIREEHPEALYALGAGLMAGDMSAGVAGFGQAVAANNQDRRRMDMQERGWDREDARFDKTFGLQQAQFGLQQQALGTERAQAQAAANATVGWLRSVGAPEPIIQLAQAGQGAEAMKLYQAMTQDNSSYGLTPGYFRDASGNVVPGQFSNTGEVKLSEIPEGYTALPPGDLNADRARGSALGKSQGEVLASLPNGLATASSTVAQIDELIQHPGLGSILGPIDQNRPAWMLGEQGNDALSRFQQLQGKAFLEAYGMLKGGGAITEVEGLKAESAMARMNRAQSAPVFQQALRDFRDAVKAGQEKLLRSAGVPPEQWGSYLNATPGAGAGGGGGGGSTVIDGVSIRRLD